MKKVNVLALGLAVLLAFGCGGDEKKDDPTPQNPVYGNRTCVPVKHISSSGDIWDYEYNAAGQITKVTHTDPDDSWETFNELIKYNTAGQIEEITQYRPAINQFEQHRLYAYSPDSLVISETISTRSVPNGTTVVQNNDVNEFEYDAAKRLTKILMRSISKTITFTYLANGNILENNYTGNLQNHLEQSRLFEFNTNKTPWGNVTYLNLPSSFLNYGNGISSFTKLPNSIVLTSYNLDGSVNNQNSFTFNYSYTLNSDAYPTSQMMTRAGQGPLTGSWTYNCQ